MDARKKKAIRSAVWAHYRAHGRDALPWRKTRDPYKILVSEIMLQQTQVARVVPYYRTFVSQFPTVRSLASAPLGEVLRLWQGLGYNRRAKMLHEAARIVVAQGGRMPRTYEGLRALPGIGPYTAGAVCVFAYDQPVPLIETNVRTVLFHHALNGRTQVADSELQHVAEALLDRARPREWHWALMDYGSHLKQQGVRVNSVSKHYARQSKFDGSDRQARGMLLRALTEGPHSERALRVRTGLDVARCRRALATLTKDALVQRGKGVYTLPE